MIEIVYGAKGSGKTAKLVEMANTSKQDAKGLHVYVDKNNGRIHDLDHFVRLVNAKEYGNDSSAELLSFLKGMISVNYDIQMIYIDSIEKIVATPLEGLQEFFDGIACLSQKSGVSFTITVNGLKEELPTFVSRFIK